jgi:hypothetical protein
MFEIKSERELLTLLKLISEESVRMSRKALNETSDPYVSKYYENLKDDEERFNVSLTEQEEAEAEEPADEPTEEPAEEPAEEPDEAEEEVDDEAEEGLEPKDFGASFDSIIKAINNLRAGRSLKDSTIRDEVSTYYDRLSEDERGVLQLFLEEIAKILAGVIDGDEAQDPSDPSTYFNITKRDEGEPDPDAEEETQQEDEPVEDEAGGEGEDTTPPIRVNEVQDTLQLRRKIRRMMLRG